MRRFDFIRGTEILYGIKWHFLGKKLLLLPAFFFIFSETSAQNPALEFASGDGNPTGNGPVTSATIRFRTNKDNPTGNIFATQSPSVTATFTLLNQQYMNHPQNTNRNSSDPNNPSSVIGWRFWGSGGSGSTAPIFPAINFLSDPSNSHFTSLPSDNFGTGIDVTANRSVLLANGVYVLNGKLFSGKHHMHDLRVDFSTPVSNPVVHISGLGATFSGTGCTAELELLTPDLTLSKLSGTSTFYISGNDILNTALEPRASGAGVAHGSVLIEGEEITSLLFRVYVRGQSSTDGTDWGTQATEDQWTMGFSTALADLEVTKTVDDPTPEMGGNVVFTIEARNNGPSNSGEVIVEEYLPEGYSYINHSASAGTYEPLLGIWDVGDLNYGVTQTLTLTAKVTTAGDYINSVRISGAIADPIDENNTDSEETEPRVKLPVVWLYQQADQKKEGNLIKWGTAQEKNNEKFVVYRSTDGGHTWHAIGSVNAVGQSSTQVDYEFLDTTANAYAEVYYRIKQVDLDGSFDYSGVIRLKTDQTSWEPGLKLYPNPYSSGELMLTIPHHLKDKKVDLSLIDAWGRSISRTFGVMGSIAPEFLENAKNQPPGLYIISCNTGIEVYNVKLLVN
ncbi:hypothetical protein [Negadavirga shengliensis]|uniref:DUF11 domain-containing protein n=1 Tax=Negadavirga shengliensis TaxID=1389218 RepID=A0ABV9T291_9BACT